jgi:nucleotide-binding universal stress UspA family protein
MKKILVAFDSSAFSESALEYAFHFAPKEESLIVGVFVEDLSYVGYATLFGDDYFTFNPTLIERMEEEAEGKIGESMKRFEEICRQRQINYKVHLDKGVPVNELVRESLFADLIVIGYRAFFSNVTGEASFLKDILSDSQCPVIPVPENFKPMRSVLLTFDGRTPSIYSIRQFTQTFPQLAKDLPVTMLSISKTKEETLEYEELMKEYLSIHYGTVNYELLAGQPDEAILTVAGRMESPIIVMGAFGRSGISRFFSKSAASGLLKEQSLPIFVSHK